MQVVRRGASRQGDEGDLAARKELADPFGDAAPVELRQAEVDQGDSRPPVDGALDAFEPVRGDLDAVSGRLEELLESAAQIRVVLDHEHARRLAVSPRARPL